MKFTIGQSSKLILAVAPLVGAWIEIYEIAKQLEIYVVAPLVGAWIEISSMGAHECRAWSLPSWERGLKLVVGITLKLPRKVAPLVGAWIEILVELPPFSQGEVAPLVGAWIEIFTGSVYIIPKIVAPLVGAWIEMPPLSLNSLTPMSLPSWERGLKYENFYVYKCMRYRRSPRGSVD